MDAERRDKILRRAEKCDEVVWHMTGTYLRDLVAEVESLEKRVKELEDKLRQPRREFNEI